MALAESLTTKVIGAASPEMTERRIMLAVAGATVTRTVSPRTGYAPVCVLRAVLGSTISSSVFQKPTEPSCWSKERLATDMTVAFQVTADTNA